MIEQALFKHLPELTDQLGVEHIKPLLDRITIHGVSAGTVLVVAPLFAFFGNAVAVIISARVGDSRLYRLTADAALAGGAAAAAGRAGGAAGGGAG